MVAIIGAGISGLTLAWILKEKKISYRLLEASNKAGGCLDTIHQHGYIMEKGPNSILCNTKTLDFFRELGLHDELILNNDISKQRFILQNGTYKQLPSGPLNFLFGSFFSWKGKMALFQEMRKPKADIQNETLTQFIKRRFDAEFVEKALSPFIGGIFAGNPDELLVKETFAFLDEYEKVHGSIIKGLKANKGTSERKQAYTFKNGIDTLTEKLASITKPELNKPVGQLKRSGDKWLVTSGDETFEADQVILSLPAAAAAKILPNELSTLKNSLSKVTYPEMVVLHSVFPKSAVQHPLNGFGGLHPKSENTFTAGSVWSSSVFPGRCKEDEVLLTSFIGGMQFQSSVQYTDEEIREKATQELKKLYKIEGQPTFQHVYRWEKAIPQYDINILPVKDCLPQAEAMNLFICSNVVGGVSIPDCMEKAFTLGQKIQLGL